MKAAEDEQRKENEEAENNNQNSNNNNSTWNRWKAISKLIVSPSTSTTIPTFVRSQSTYEVTVDVSTKSPGNVLVVISDNDGSYYRHPDKMKTKILFCKAIGYFYKNVDQMAKSGGL